MQEFCKLITSRGGFWNTRRVEFFAMSHGKDPCDGGTIKRLAYRHSLQGGNIQTPLSLFQWASPNIANMKMDFVDPTQ